MLDKAIAHGKEWRKSYRGAKSVSTHCRNHGCCPYCENERTNLQKQKTAPSRISTGKSRPSWAALMICSR